MNTIKRISAAMLMLWIAIICFASGKVNPNAITMEAYEQGWLDDNGTIALKNNTDEVIHNVTFQITYLNMSGKALDYETYTKNVEIKPGLTKQIDIPAYQSGRQYSYYRSDSSSVDPHRFKIKYELKGYNDKYTKNATALLSGEDISPVMIIAVFAIAILSLGIYIGLCVLVAYMAKSRHQSQVLWLIVALFTTPILAIIVLLCIGKSYDDAMRID